MYRVLILLAAWLPLLPGTAQTHLQEYREQVLGHSRQLEAARAHSQATGERQLLSRTDFLPRLSLAGDFSCALREDSELKPWSFALQPEIIATLYKGGGVRAAYREAMLNHAIAREEELDTELSIRYAADYTYWNLSAMAEYRAAMAEYVRIIRSLKEIIDRRFSEGYIAKGDVLMIEARLSTAEYELLMAEENFEEALHNFNILRGTPSDRPVELGESIFDPQPRPERKSLDQTLDNRPDYQTSRLRTAAAQNAITIARAGYNPRLEVGVRGSWHPESPNRTGATQIDGALFARLSVPIFGWGARRHSTGAARATAQEVEWQQSELMEQILREERNGWSAVVESQARVESVGESLRIAGENLDLGTYSYSEGLTTILDVLQAQLNWIQIYTNVITAHFNYAIACSEYRRIIAEQ